MATTDTQLWTRDASDALRWACVIVAVATIVPGLALLSLIWQRAEYLGHGYVIPAVSLWLIVSDRAKIASALRDGEVPALGPVAVLAASLFEAAAVSGEVVTAAGAGIPLVLAATAYAVGGTRLLRTAIVPIGFLALMVPIPNFLQAWTLLKLKLLVSEIAVSILQTAGYVVAQQGNTILIPGHDLFVADACSGFTSIVTMLPLAVVVSYLLSRGVWRRVVIIGSVIPLALVGNTLRILLTVGFISHGWLEFRDGIFHENLGLATFALGTVALIGVARILR